MSVAGADAYPTAHCLSARVSCDTGMCRPRAQQVTEVPFTAPHIIPPPTLRRHTILHTLALGFCVVFKIPHSQVHPLHVLCPTVCHNTSIFTARTLHNVTDKYWLENINMRHGVSRSLTNPCPSPPWQTRRHVQGSLHSAGPAGGSWAGFPRGSVSSEG